MVTRFAFASTVDCYCYIAELRIFHLNYNLNTCCSFSFIYKKNRGGGRGTYVQHLLLHNSTVPLHMDSETGPSFETVTDF